MAPSLPVWQTCAFVALAALNCACSDSAARLPTLSHGSAGSDSGARRLADAANSDGAASDGAALPADSSVTDTVAVPPTDATPQPADPEVAATVDRSDAGAVLDAEPDAPAAPPVDAAQPTDVPPPQPDVPPPPPDAPSTPADVPPSPPDVPPPPPDVSPPPPDVSPPPADVPPPPKDTATGPKCGDGKCDAGESTANCAADCPGGGSGTWTCGDKKCDIGEQFYCEGDCPGPVCGDGKCQWPENKDNCAKDCKSGGSWVCGDNKCDIGEQFYCNQDCQPAPLSCVQTKCGSQWQACAAKPGCDKIVQCALKCNGSWSCGQNCLPGGAANNKEAVAVLVCGQTQGCL